VVSRSFDDGIARGIEHDDADRVPVTGVPCPTTWMGCFASRAKGVPGDQDVLIAPCVSLRWADVAHGAVTVIMVVPVHSPVAGDLEVGEALSGELRAVFRRSEQRFHEGVVVADAWARARVLDAEPVQHSQHGGGLEGGAVVAMQHRLVDEAVQPLGQCRSTQQIHRVVGAIALAHTPADDLAAGWSRTAKSLSSLNNSSPIRWPNKTLPEEPRPARGLGLRTRLQSDPTDDGEAAVQAGVLPRQLSFKHTVQVWVACSQRQFL
jgi:hypothetical protein